MLIGIIFRRAMCLYKCHLRKKTVTSLSLFGLGSLIESRPSAFPNRRLLKGLSHHFEHVTSCRSAYWMNRACTRPMFLVSKANFGHGRVEVCRKKYAPITLQKNDSAIKWSEKKIWCRTRVSNLGPTAWKAGSLTASPAGHLVKGKSPVIFIYQGRNLF